MFHKQNSQWLKKLEGRGGQENRPAKVLGALPGGKWGSKQVFPESAN